MRRRGDAETEERLVEVAVVVESRIIVSMFEATSMIMYFVLSSPRT